jgi:hypothetical protein
MRSLHTSLLTLVLASPFVTLANRSFGAADGPFDDSTKNKPSIHWKKADDEINGKFSKVELAKLKASTETLHTLLQDSALRNSGLESVWHAEYSADKAGNLINYGIDCDFSSTADGATTGSLTVMVNDYSSLVGHITIDNKDYMTLPAAGAVRNQCPYYEIHGGTTPENVHTPNQNIWVVTARPDVLPYTPITRKEYLEISIGWLGDTKAQIIADVKQRTPVRSKEEQEAIKKREIDELSSRYSGAELQMRTQLYMENYRSDEDYLKEHIDQATADVDSTISFIKGMLNRLSPATLSAPAIISPNTREFEGFRDGDPGMVMLVRNNPDFSQPGAPREKPNFLLITWKSEPGDDAAQAIGTQIAKTLDTHYLKTLLSK